MGSDSDGGGIFVTRKGDAEKNQENHNVVVGGSNNGGGNGSNNGGGNNSGGSNNGNKDGQRSDARSDQMRTDREIQERAMRLSARGCLPLPMTGWMGDTTDENHGNHDVPTNNNSFNSISTNSNNSSSGSNNNSNNNNIKNKEINSIKNLNSFNNIKYEHNNDMTRVYDNISSDCTNTDRHTDRYTDKHNDRHIDKHTERTDRYSDRGRHTNTDKQDRHADRYDDTHSEIFEMTPRSPSWGRSRSHSTGTGVTSHLNDSSISTGSSGFFSSLFATPSKHLRKRYITENNEHDNRYFYRKDNKNSEDEEGGAILRESRTNSMSYNQFEDHEKDEKDDFHGEKYGKYDKYDNEKYDNYDREKEEIQIIKSKLCLRVSVRSCSRYRICDSNPQEEGDSVWALATGA